MTLLQIEPRLTSLPNIIIDTSGYFWQLAQIENLNKTFIKGLHMKASHQTASRTSWINIWTDKTILACKLVNVWGLKFRVLRMCSYNASLCDRGITGFIDTNSASDNLRKSSVGFCIKGLKKVSANISQISITWVTLPEQILYLWTYRKKNLFNSLCCGLKTELIYCGSEGDNLVRME